MNINNKKVWYAPNKFESYGEAEIKAVEACLREGWLAGFGPKSVEFGKRSQNDSVRSTEYLSTRAHQLAY